MSKLNLNLEQEARAVMLGRERMGQGVGVMYRPHSILGKALLRPHPPRALARVPISMNYLWEGQPNG